MAKEQTFSHPPKGHVALLAYDSVNDRWQVVHVDADGNLQVDLVAAALPTGAATAAKQLPDGHNVTVDNVSLAVTGTFYPGTQPVSAATLPLPTGAATSAKQLADGHNVTVDNASLAVTGTFYPGTQPVSAAALPLPTGAATAAKQLADGHNVTVDNIVPVTAGGGDVLFNFEDTVKGAIADTNLAGGTPTVYGTAVPTDKVWVIQTISFYYAGTQPTYIAVGSYDGSSWYHCYMLEDPSMELYHPWSGAITLKDGDKIFCIVGGATAGDDLYVRYSGYVMDMP